MDVITISGPSHDLSQVDNASGRYGTVLIAKWIVYGTDGLGGKGYTRMRPKLHLPVLGRAFRVTGVMA